MTPQPLLDARDITVRFGGLTAVDAVSARFMPGELVGIIGPNGAGKTTLIGAVCGLVRPTGGTITAFGQDRSAQPFTRQGPADNGAMTPISPRGLSNHDGCGLGQFDLHNAERR